MVMIGKNIGTQYKVYKNKQLLQQQYDTCNKKDEVIDKHLDKQLINNWK